MGKKKIILNPNNNKPSICGLTNYSILSTIFYNNCSYLYLLCLNQIQVVFKTLKKNNAAMDYFNS